MSKSDISVEAYSPRTLARIVRAKCPVTINQGVSKLSAYINGSIPVEQILPKRLLNRREELLKQRNPNYIPINEIQLCTSQFTAGNDEQITDEEIKKISFEYVEEIYKVVVKEPCGYFKSVQQKLRNHVPVPGPTSDEFSATNVGIVYSCTMKCSDTEKEGYALKMDTKSEEFSVLQSSNDTSGSSSSSDSVMSYESECSCSFCDNVRKKMVVKEPDCKQVEISDCDCSFCGNIPNNQTIKQKTELKAKSYDNVCDCNFCENIRNNKSGKQSTKS